MPPPPPPIRRASEPLAWRESLRAAGWPTALVVIDFENYFESDYSLKKVSPWEYLADERYQELGRSTVHVPDGALWGDPVWCDGDQAGDLADLRDRYGPNLEGCTVVAHNLGYDGLILREKYGIKIPHGIDLLALARYDNARAKNDLDSLAKRFGIKREKGDTKRFKGLRLEHRDAEPGRWVELIKYANNDAAMEYELFGLLMPRMRNARLELDLQYHTLRLFWEPRLVVDTALGDEIKAEMRAEVQTALDAAGHTHEEISGTNSFTALVVDALTDAGDDPKKYMKPGKPLKDGKPRWLLAAAKADVERDLLLAHESPRVRALMEARAAIKSWPNHISRVEKLQSTAAICGGRLPIPVKYHGAHTGRWSGDGGINLQNLGSRGHELISRVRHMLTAPEDKRLVVVDLSAIEARVLAWLAGQDDLLARFAAGEEIYCGFAAKVLNAVVRKPTALDPPPVAAWLKWARNSVGKVGILGCGYGMGGDKTEAYAGYTIDNATAHALVKTYRTEHPKIVAFWYALERAFVRAAQHGEPTDLRHGVRVYRDGPDTMMRLPSGRVMRYSGLKVSFDDRGRSRLWMRDPMTGAPQDTWGGTLAENITQAVARDILAEGLVRCEAEVAPVVLHVHDELVVLADESDADKALAGTIEILSTAPVWAEGLPLDAEGWVGNRYAK